MRAPNNRGSSMKKLILATTIVFACVAGSFAGGAILLPRPAVAAGVLGDLSSLQAIVTDVQAIAGTGDFVKAEKRITDFETLWDKDEASLKPMNKKAWHHVDDASDAALKALRTKKPEASEVAGTLTALSAALANP